jgi:hypothetical protein
VTPAELDGSAAERWRLVRAWLDVAQPVSSSPLDTENQLTQVPPFPLAGIQLRELQIAVDGIVRARLRGEDKHSLAKSESIYRSALVEQPITIRARLHNGLRHVQRSSVVLAGILLLMLALNFAGLFLFRTSPNHLILAGNLLLAGAASVTWTIHHFQLLSHVEWFHAHHPNIGS